MNFVLFSKKHKSSKSMAQAVDACVLALLEDVLAVAPRRGVRVTRAPDGTVSVSVYAPAPAQHTRRAAAAAKQSQAAAPPRPSRPVNSAGRRKANRVATRAGEPLPFPPPAVTAAADGDRLVPSAAQAPEARAEPAASTTSTTASASSTSTRPSAAAKAAPAPAALAAAPPPSAAWQLVQRSHASASDARPSPGATMRPLSPTGAAAKQRTPPQSTTAPPPSTTAAPSLPPSRADVRGGNAPKRLATQPAPPPPQRHTPRR